MNHYRSLIGLCLNQPVSLQRAIDLGINFEHFAHDASLSAIWSALADNHANMIPTGPKFIHAIVGDGFIADLAELSSNAPHTLPVDYFIAEVKKETNQRKAISHLTLVTAEMKAGNFSALENFRDNLNALTDSLNEGPEKDYGVKPIIESTVDLIEDAVKRKAEGNPLFIPTGFRSLNKTLQGLRPQALYIIGGRPGTGKSELCVNLAYNIADDGNPVIYFTFEMTAEELMMRIIARIAQVNDQKMAGGDLTGDEMDRVSGAMLQISKSKLHIVDSSPPQWPVVKTTIRRMVKNHGLKVVVIDYVQQLSIPGFKASDRVRELTVISGEMKQLARELNIAIVCAAQLNREAHDKTDTPPSKRQLKESGSLEQDANVIILIHRRAESYDLIIDKNRHGAEGAIPMRPKFEFHTFDEGR